VNTGFGGIWRRRTLRPSLSLSLSRRFALLFTAYALLLLCSLALTRLLYEGLAGDAELVNDSGMMRSLSQQIAVRAIDSELVNQTALLRSLSQQLGVQAIGAEGGDDESPRLLLAAAARFETHLTRLSARLEATAWVVIAGDESLREAEHRLRGEWQDYRRVVVERHWSPQTGSGYAERRREILARTERLHAAADRLTRRVIENGERVRGFLDLLVIAVILVNGVVAIMVYAILNRRVLAPVAALAAAARDFTADRGDLRVAYQADDEVGELVRACNESAGHVHFLLGEQRRFQQIIARTTDLVAIIWPDGRCISLNPAGRRLLGIDEKEQVIGLPLIERSLAEKLRADFASGTVDAWQGETSLATASGEAVPVSLVAVPHREGELLYFSLIARDTRERAAYEARLLHQATHDALTGLPNVTLLRDRLGQALAVAQRHLRGLAVLFLDLDHFKNVNDSLGHACGDALLVDIGRRLAGSLRESDTVARQGGDEFVILLADLSEESQTAMIVEKLLAALAAPCHVGGRDLHVTASIGIAVFPRDGESAETLLRKADTALYRAKEVGRNNFQFHTAAMNALAQERMEIEQHLRNALAAGEFSLLYQPQVDLQSGELRGLEALLRWHNPLLGEVPPTRFIPIAEEIGLIGEIGHWVLREACRQNRAWQAAGLACRRVAVNVSACQFAQCDFAARVAGVLDECGIAPHWLELEITESVLMRDAEAAGATLRELKALGICIAIDDFGTGYSSLAYLKRFPIDALKIDRSFVRDITSDPDDAAIARTVISMAHDLRLAVVAEGVETAAQLAFLRGRQCDIVQGYYFSRPLPAGEVAVLLAGEGPPFVAAEAAAAPAHTLLLVDDEPLVCEALKRQLRREGYRILVAASANEALEILAVEPVGVIVADYRMPGMNGVELLRRARELSPDTVRMMLTGHADLQNVKAAINAGAVHKFFSKPWDDDELRNALREAFRNLDQQLAERPAILPSGEA